MANDEGYVGVKFRIENEGNEIPDDFRLDSLKKWCGVFDKNNFAPPYDGGSSGNLSFRLNKGDDAFVITGTATSLKEAYIFDDRFVTVPRVDLKSRIVYSRGMRDPSSESMIHYAIYKNRKDVKHHA